MKHIFCLMFCVLTLSVYAQNGTIKGTIKDKSSGETLIGANVVAGSANAITDLDGNFSLQVPEGDYALKVSYVGFQPFEKKVHVVSGKTSSVVFDLQGVTLSEVEVVADVAKTRETPIAFATISSEKIQETLASQDIPMMLNKTPGVYATQQGGGEGDARVNIRGFNQRNVAVMFDGVPMNDMENGWVYWSNWFGTDNVTRNVQVQRGLGASKLASPAVGGSINIITKGIEAKRSVILKQEFTINDDFEMKRNSARTTLSMTTGRLAHGWGFTGALSYKSGEGWVDNTGSKMYSWFGKIEKQYKSHLITATGFGAPQTHNQRAFHQRISTYDSTMAKELGVSSSTFGAERGIRFNPHWGYVKRLRDQTDTNMVSRDALSERVNFFHKPVFSLKDFWTVNEHMYVSNILYASYGFGGGTAAATNTGTLLPDPATGLYDFENAYRANAYPGVLRFGERLSNKFIRSSINNHQWYGFLSTTSYSLTKKINLSGGIDLRTYKGIHYQTPYDLLGGDLMIDNANFNQVSQEKRIGDKIGYNYEGHVQWGGLFGLATYTTPKVTVFVNASVMEQGYMRKDYFRRQDVEIDGKKYSEVIGYGDVFYRNSSGDTLTYVSGKDSKPFIKNDTVFVAKNMSDTMYIKNPNSYSIYSKESSPASSGYKWVPGYTFKTGANYNIDEHLNAFANVGYLNRTPQFDYVLQRNNKFWSNILNEKITAAEAGASYHSRTFTVNINAYYTIWKNKPTTYSFTDYGTGRTFIMNIGGLNALHKGVEFDFAYRIIKGITAEGMVSLGDWTWTSNAKYEAFDETGLLYGTAAVNAKGVHVGDAAQTTYSVSLRFEPTKGFYIMPHYTFFGKNFSSMNPESLNFDSLAGKESWRMPDYGLVDLFTGYTMKVSKTKFDLRLGVLNFFNKEYISDATNNDVNTSPFRNFDAQSAGVFMGMGRRYNISLTATF